MATVINNPADGGTTSDSGVGVIVAVIVALVLVGLFIAYGLPAMRGTAPQQGGTTIDVDLPNPTPSPNPTPTP